jgi:Universal stress protein family
MRVLVWIVEDTWKATITAAAAFVPADADIKLLYVREDNAESVARGALHSLLGRPHPRPAESMQTISEESAHDLLAESLAALGRQASTEVRSGKVGREVVTAAQEVDLLVVARDGSRARSGPRSLGPATRFAVEHVQCGVLLVWPD